MKVYELVVNKISATNGSLWVSNAGKVVSAVKLDVKPYEFFSASHADYSRYVAGLRMGDVLIKMPENPTTEELDEEAFSTASGDGIVTRTCYSHTTLAGMQLIDVTADKPNLAANQGARFDPVFETGFRFDCTFPIITRNDKLTYDTAYELVQYYRDTLSGLILAKAAQASIDSVETALEAALEDADPNKYVSLIRSYYKYFAGGDYYYVRFDDNNLPVFKAGDLLRCLKWTNGGIKYYDAVVCNYIRKGYVILLAPSFLDKKTTIEYDNSLNPKVTVEEDSRNLDLYKSTRNYKEPEQENRIYNDDDTTTVFTYDEALDMSLMGMVEVDDSLVLMGHLWDKQRQNAVYITSTDDAAPYMDVLSGINRPDYSVNYHIPVYKTVKLFQCSYNLTSFVGYNNLVEIPYTGDYYILDSSIENFTCEFVCFKHTSNVYLAKGKTLPQVQGVTLLYYLNIVPDKCTSLGEPTDNFYINLEDGGHIKLEDTSGSIIQEKQFKKLILESTRTVKARMGNLDGIQDELFPIDKLPCGYGLYGLNVFLTGEFYLSNGLAVADLGKDAMAFAIAASREGNAAINLLRTDLVRADNLLKASHYNKGTLKTAGMYIGNDSNGDPGIVIWGNKILFATTDLEFSGKVPPTMLLADGKIQGKYLGVDEAHGTVDATVSMSLFDIKSGNETTHYTSVDLSSGTVRVYRPKIKNTASDGTVYYTESDQVYYVRRFMVNNDSGTIRWLVVSPDGYPTSRNAFGEYTSVEYLNLTYYNENDAPVTYSNGVLPSSVEADFVANYSTPLKVWSLEKNGKGNLGGSTLYWDSLGKVVVSGVLYSNEGNIGGLNLGDNALYTLARDGNGVAFNPLLISTQQYGYYTNEVSMPYILLNSTNSTGTIEDRLVITSRGIFQLGNAAANTSNVLNWYDFISALVPAVLFSLSVIPIYIESKDTWTLLARLSCGKTVFSSIEMTFQEGKYALNFPRMEMNSGIAETWGQEREWFLEKLAKGQIQFLISGQNAGYCSDSGADEWHFNVDKMYLNPSHGYRKEGEFLKATIAYMSFKGTNHSLNVGKDTTDYARAYSYSAKIMRTEDRSLWGSVDKGGIFYWGYNNAFNTNSFNNYILVETADDSSGNWGGFTLTALYIRTFDDRFIENTQTETSDYSAEHQQQLNDETTLRNYLINTYGSGGTRIVEMNDSLDTKKDDMTSTLLSNLATTISGIESDIQDIIDSVERWVSDVGLDSLLRLQNEYDASYADILSRINDLEAENSTVTPPSTSPDSDNTDNKYTVTGSGYHNNTSDAVSADGTTSIAVGKITDIDSSLSEVTPTVWAVYDIEGSSVISKSNVTLEASSDEYIIKAIVNSNPTSSTRKARIFVTFDGGNHYGYVNVYQAASSGSVTPTANTDMDTYLNVFKASSLSGESISVGSSVYDLLDYAFEAMKTKSSSLSYGNIMNGPVVDLSLASTTSDTTAAMKGWFLGLLLTSLYPFRGSVSGSNISNAILKDAMSTWGIDAWGDPDSSSAVSSAKFTIESYNVNTYTSKYKGMLMGAILYSVIYSDTTFLDKYKALKDTTYTSAFVQSYTHEGNDGDYTADNGNGSYKHSIRGQYFFPYPPTNDTSSSSGIMGRDNNSWTSGKALREQSAGTLAISDINTDFSYYMDILGTASGRSYSSGSRAYTLLYKSHWSGNKTVNQIKNTTAYWRYRPAYAYNDTTVDSNTYGLAFGSGSNDPSTSYPSGHTGYIWGTTYVYAAIGGLTDSKIEDLFKRAYVYSQGRVIVGAHWQFCVEMGRIAASCMFAMLCANTKVMDDLYSIHSIS